MYKRKKMAHGGPHPEDKKKRKMMRKKAGHGRMMYVDGGMPKAKPN